MEDTLLERIEKIMQLDESCRRSGIKIMTNCIGTAFYAKGLTDYDESIFPDTSDDELIQRTLSNLNQVEQPVHGALVVLKRKNKISHMGIVLREEHLWPKFYLFHRPGCENKTRKVPFIIYLLKTRIFYKVEYYM